MHPVCFSVGSIAIHCFGIAMALGFGAGLANWIWLGRKEGRDVSYCSDLLFWIMISGVLGARIAYVVSEFPEYARNPIAILQVWRGGLIYYGGFVGACAAIFIFARRRHEKLLSVLDFAATAVPLAHAFGRIGCFLNGCCHGKEYSGPLAVRFPGFPNESPAWFAQFDAGRIGRYDTHTLPVHPVQLYEAAFNLALYAAMAFAYRNRKRPGEITALYLMTYPVGRFLLEFLRGDDRMPLFGFSVAQIASACLVLVGAAVLLFARSKSGKTI